MNSLALINEFLGQPANVAEHGYQIDHILEFCHWFMGALFVGWSAFFIFVLFRFHKSRQPVADHAGVKSGISTHLEFSVVLIEAVLLLGFAIPLWAKRVNQFPPGKDAIVTLGELHVPVDRPVIIELSSKDVIHDFFLPSMRIAADAIPGSLIPMWFKPIKTGTYEVICGQLCGLGHSGMKGTLVVDTPADYQTWLKERAELAGTQNAPPPTQQPPGAPPVGPTPGTVPPPGAPKN